MAKIYLNHLTKVFDTTVIAVDDVTLEVPDKGFVSLLGPSGCGKTTTLRIISGLETPTKGRVFFDDEDVTEVPPRERDVVMVFQFPTLYSTMSVFDNIAFPLEARKTSKSEIRKEVMRVAELLGITHVLGRKPGELDVGMRQRVVLAKCLIRRPKVYLLDEPLTILDPKDRVELRAELKKLQKEFGQTFIYVTHDQSEALTLADKIAVMNKGKLLQYDTPDDIYKNPASTFVAWFVGNPGMNLIDCNLREIKGLIQLDAGPFTYDITYLGDTIRKEASGPKLVLGIRPEHIQVSIEKRSGWIKARCVMVEPVGSRFILHLQIDGMRLKAKVPLAAGVPTGGDVWIQLPRDHMRLFDGKTNKLIV